MRIPNLVLLILSVITHQVWSDRELEEIGRRWEEAQRDMASTSGRMSALSRGITWTVDRRTDAVTASLQDARRSFVRLTHGLTTNSVTWSCLTRRLPRSHHLDKALDKEWRRCMRSISNRVATKEKRLSDLSGELRRVGLPCYLNMECGARGSGRGLNRTCRGKGCDAASGVGERTGCCHVDTAVGDMDEARKRARDLERELTVMRDHLESAVTSCLNRVNAYIDGLQQAMSDLALCKQEY